MTQAWLRPLPTRIAIAIIVIAELLGTSLRRSANAVAEGGRSCVPNNYRAGCAEQTNWRRTEQPD
jgi:hypothetical protein